MKSRIAKLSHLESMLFDAMSDGLSGLSRGFISISFTPFLNLTFKCILLRSVETDWLYTNLSFTKTCIHLGL